MSACVSAHYIATTHHSCLSGDCRDGSSSSRDELRSLELSDDLGLYN